MNKIKELAKRAGATIYERSGGTEYGTVEFDIKEFAKMLLLECRLLVADTRIEYYSDEADDALVSVLSSFDKHFGIK